MKKRAGQLFACVALLAIAGSAEASCVTTGTSYLIRTVCTNSQTNIIGNGSNLGSVDPVLSQPKPAVSSDLSSLLNKSVTGIDMNSLYNWIK